MDTDPDVMEGLISLNVTSVTMPCRLFGADMAEWGHGRIMNVSSLGGFIPDPYFNVYGPTKTNWANNAGKAEKILLGLFPAGVQTAFIAKWQKKLIEEV